MADGGHEASEAPYEAASAPFLWRKNLVLFLATVASVLFTGATTDRSIGDIPDTGFVSTIGATLVATAHSPLALRHGAEFTASLLAILLAHEFGHYFAARAHRVDTSLPFFIPLPLLSPFGTMGAVIRMRGTIHTRRALLDIGASGPLAGLVVAIPLYIVGLQHSTLAPIEGGAAGMSLGESVGLRLLERVAGIAPPAGMDVVLSPMAFAAWAGMFVTMINLIPAAQLDGGHVAFALFGKRQDGYARIVHRSMLAFFCVSVASFVLRDLRAGEGLARFGNHVESSLFWLVWFEVLAILGTVGRDRARDAARAEKEGRKLLGNRPRIVGLASLVVLASVGHDHDSPLLWIAWFAILGLLLGMEALGGVFAQKDLLDHPPTTDPAPLDPLRKVIAVVTLAFFVFLFMPTPISL